MIHSGCTKQYRCSYDTYLPYFLSLELSVIIYLAFDATVHNKDYANVINDIDKLVFKLSIANILDPELIHDDPFFTNTFRFMKLKKINMLS